jgi:DNA-binding FadR family transcriptional regulator
MNTSEKKSLSASTAEKIQDYILSNSLKTGDSLPSEAEFMEMFKTSRSTIREALKQIQAHGILDIKPRRGAVIKDCNINETITKVGWALRINPDPSNLKDLAESRYITEMAAIPLIVNRATGIDMDELEMLAETLIKEKDLAERRKLDVAFHRRLMNCTGNSLLVSLTDITRIFFNQLMVSSPNSVFPSLGKEVQIYDHRRIVAALRSRNKESVIREMEAHFLSYKQYFAINEHLFE